MKSRNDRNRSDRATTQLAASPGYRGRQAAPNPPGGAAIANRDARTFNVVQRLVAAGEEVWITVTGRSMEPTLRPGDRVLLRASRSTWRSGRVVLSELRGRAVLHRLVRVDGQNVTTAGDACRFEDPPVPHSALIAEAVAVQTSRGVVALRLTLRFGVVPLLPYVRATVRQKIRRARWRLVAALNGMSRNDGR